MDQYNERFHNDPPVFRPSLQGCVARDARLASAVQGCYIDTFSTIAADVYYSLICEGKSIVLCDLFEELARRDLEQFRQLGELLLALGGERLLCEMRCRCNCTPLPHTDKDIKDTALRQSISARKRNIDRFETLMGRTGDRVARSVLAKLLAAERRILDALEHAAQTT